jgi:hypothetical protein
MPYESTHDDVGLVSLSMVLRAVHYLFEHVILMEKVYSFCEVRHLQARMSNPEIFRNIHH